LDVTPTVKDEKSEKGGQKLPSLPDLPPVAVSPAATSMKPESRQDTISKKEELTLNAGTVHLNIREANFKNGNVELSAEGHGFGREFSPRMLHGASSTV
jgi:hypothetical protein